MSLKSEVEKLPAISIRQTRFVSLDAVLALIEQETQRGVVKIETQDIKKEK